MNLIDALPVVSALIGINKPVFMWGKPGVGKSDFARQLAKSLFNGVMIDFRAVLLDVVDLRGIPSTRKGVTRWNPPDFLPQAERDGKTGLLFIDELNAAPQMVQAGLMQLTLDWALGEYRLPPDWRIIAAGNYVSDKAAAQRMPSALANRFAHVDIDADSVAACAHWLTIGVAPEVIAFIRFRPNLLHKMDGTDLRAFPTPRAWVSVSDAIKATPPSMHYRLAASIIGESVAAEFKGFLDVYKSLPRTDSIANDPTGAVVPSEPSALYAIAGALGRTATAANLKAFVTYLARLPVEFSIMAITDAVKRDSTLKSAPGFTNWAIHNQDVSL